ncbi:hypothetical protein FOIG_03242 [Fusarium odoratissimum NRRL 54006]|uniref:Uncharacterized protein n=2 Tax=Fusarium oxysporum species complex TaxID=171631 RepID=X0JZ34_FUSO5|nr:uncharacterized protein FOIG_03242 [Fusarium odoratissimum NRRL 54006]EXM06458.1 hypothetical protein FOIG_03242 [Fusarium odoratissimum NRRL 54006]TXC08293.1 hypothetical protein FocTR4_00003124 [Fusarium oxysporum f. sp. cubense]
MNTRMFLTRDTLKSIPPYQSIGTPHKRTSPRLWKNYELKVLSCGVTLNTRFCIMNCTLLRTVSRRTFYIAIQLAGRGDWLDWENLRGQNLTSCTLRIEITYPIDKVHDSPVETVSSRISRYPIRCIFQY